jgi:hypothetical protein
LKGCKQPSIVKRVSTTSCRDKDIANKIIRTPRLGGALIINTFAIFRGSENYYRAGGATICQL